MLRWLNIFLPAGVACWTGVIFLSFFRGAKASAKRARSARHARRRMARDALFFRTLRRRACLELFARFALAFARLKNSKKKKSVCWGPGTIISCGQRYIFWCCLFLLTCFFCCFRFCCYNCSCYFCCWVRFGPVDISKCNPKVIP